MSGDEVGQQTRALAALGAATEVCLQRMESILEDLADPFDDLESGAHPVVAGTAVAALLLQADSRTGEGYTRTAAACDGACDLAGAALAIDDPERRLQNLVPARSKRIVLSRIRR